MLAIADCEQFTVENDLLTPTFKLKRPQLQRQYQSEINAMYAALRGDSCVSSYAPSLAPSRGPSRPISRTVSKGNGAVELPYVVAKAH